MKQHKSCESMLQNKQSFSNIFFKGSVNAFTSLLFYLSACFLFPFFFSDDNYSGIVEVASLFAWQNQTLHIHEIQTNNVFPLEQQTVLLHSKNRSHLTWTLILLTVLKRTIKYFLSSTALAGLSRFHNF